MRNTQINKRAYPPPPPPPPPTESHARKILVVSLLIVLIVVSTIALAFIATGGFAFKGNNTNPSPAPTTTPTNYPYVTPQESASPSASATAMHSASPSHSPTHSPSPSATSTSTPQPTATEGTGTAEYGNFRNGAWAQYSYDFYDKSTGQQIVDSTIKYSVNSASYKGTNCWLLNMEQLTAGDYPVNTTIVEYMRKSDMKGLHVKYYTNGMLINEYDLNSTTADPGGNQIDPNLVVSYEDVVVPAGSFNHCGKATTTNDNTVTDVWGHENLPVFGLVKMTMHDGGALMMSQELLAYGG
jgi:hypothetical protein